MRHLAENSIIFVMATKAIGVEIAFEGKGDELAQRRQELPWVQIDKLYRFETDEGRAFAREPLPKVLAAHRLPLHVRTRLETWLLDVASIRSLGCTIGSIAPPKGTTRPVPTATASGWQTLSEDQYPHHKHRIEEGAHLKQNRPNAADKVTTRCSRRQTSSGPKAPTKVTRKIEGDARVRTHHLQNSDAAIAKLRFCESRTVKVVTPIKLPRSSNRPPPEEPSDTGAVIWM